MVFNLCKQILKINDELFVIKRAIRESEKLDVDILKQYFDTEYVFKKDGVLYFTNKIETLEYEQVTTA